MHSRKLLATLVYALPLLPAVVMIVFVGSFVAQAAGDAGGAYLLRWIGWAAFMLLVLDLFTLALLLGLKALGEDERMANSGHWATRPSPLASHADRQSEEDQSSEANRSSST